MSEIRAHKEKPDTRGRLDQLGLRAHAETRAKKDLLDHKETLGHKALRVLGATQGPLV